MPRKSNFPDAAFELRDAGPNDDEFLRELSREAKTREFAGLDLPTATLNQLLEMQYNTQQAAFASQFPNALHQIVLVDGSPAGRIMTDMRDSTVTLVDIALLECHRGQGIGGKLLQQVCDDAASRQNSVKLTVRFDNPAQHLYQRAGFVQTGGDGLHLVMEWKPLLTQREQTSIVQDQAEINADGPLSSRYFRSLIGKTLPARSIDGISVDLVLESVEPLRAASRPANAGISVGDSFGLIFSGPAQPILPSATAEVSMPSGTSAEIFLSPIGWTNGLMHYESIFNRMGG